jgi:hypothetical protein
MSVDLPAEYRAASALAEAIEVLSQMLDEDALAIVELDEVAGNAVRFRAGGRPFVAVVLTRAT